MWMHLNNREAKMIPKGFQKLLLEAHFKKLPNGCVWSKKSLQTCMSTFKVEVSLTQLHTYGFVVSRCLVRCPKLYVYCI